MQSVSSVIHVSKFIKENLYENILTIIFGRRDYGRLVISFLYFPKFYIFDPKQILLISRETAPPTIVQIIFFKLTPLNRNILLLINS